MNFFCDVLANVPAMAGAPVIAGIQLMFPDLPETEAREHWILGGSADSLAGRKGVSALTPAGVQPTFFANYLETALGARNGLLSGFPDADKQAFAMVMQLTDAGANGGRVLVGSTTAASGSGARNNGFLFSQSANNAASPHQLQAQYRPGSNTSPYPQAAIAELVGKWVFIGIATDLETRVRSFYLHGLGHSVAAAESVAWAKAEVPVAFGNGYYNPSSGQTSQYDRGIAMAEAMAFDKVPTAQMWADIAQRAVMRCALRGLTVHTGQ